MQVDKKGAYRKTGTGDPKKPGKPGPQQDPTKTRKPGPQWDPTKTGKPGPGTLAGPQTGNYNSIPFKTGKVNVNDMKIFSETGNIISLS